MNRLTKILFIAMAVAEGKENYKVPKKNEKNYPGRGTKCRQGFGRVVLFAINFYLLSCISIWNAV